MTSLVIAIEGPSDTGKSTLIDGLARRFSEVDPLVFDCYVDHAGGDDKVPALADTREGQAEALRFFLGIEKSRYEMIGEGERPKLVLMDRSVFSLLAHSYAVGVENSLPTLDDAVGSVSTAAEVIIPDLVLYLKASASTIARRRDPSDEGRWFTSERFNGHINAFYDGPVDQCGISTDIRRLDASRDAGAVLEDATRLIVESMP